MFEAIEEEDRVVEKEEGLPPALLGSCNERAKELHASPSGSSTYPFSLLLCIMYSVELGWVGCKLIKV